MSGTPLLAYLLRCPACDSEVEARGVNESVQVASCGRCQKVIDLGQPRRKPGVAPLVAELPPREVAAASPEPGLASPIALRPRVPLPAEMSAVEEAGGITVTWARPLGVRLTEGLVAVCAGAYLAVRLELETKTWAPLALAVIGAGTVWAVAAALLNRVRVTTFNKKLAVKVGPVPWVGNHTLLRGAVRQLFAEARQVPGRHGEMVKRHFVVSALVGDEQRRVELVKDLPQLEQALWLEQTLERALGVRHFPVGGEVEPEEEAPPKGE